MKQLIHKLSDVQSQHIGSTTRVWQYSVVLPGARTGNDYNIRFHVLIKNDVVIGERVTVESVIQLWDGLRIKDDAFIGPNVTFTNDSFPRSKQYPEQFSVTSFKRGAATRGWGCNSTWPDDWNVRHGRCRSCDNQFGTSGCCGRRRYRTHSQVCGGEQ